VFLADGEIVDRMLEPTADAVADHMTGLTGRASAAPC
jgi:hypothetical protein